MRRLWIRRERQPNLSVHRLPRCNLRRRIRMHGFHEQPAQSGIDTNGNDASHQRHFPFLFRVSLTTAKPAPRCSRRLALARRILQRKAAFVQVKPSSASASPARTGFCRLLLCTAHRMLPIFIVLMGFLLRKGRIPSRAPFDIVLSISPDIFASNA